MAIKVAKVPELTGRCHPGMQTSETFRNPPGNLAKPEASNHSVQVPLCHPVIEGHLLLEAGPELHRSQSLPHLGQEDRKLIPDNLVADRT